MNPEQGAVPVLLPPNPGRNRNAVAVLSRMFQPNPAARSQQPTFNHSRVIIAGGKILLSFLVLTFTPTHCNQPLNKWLMQMMIYDALVIVAQYLIKMGTPPPSNQAQNHSMQEGYLLGAAAQGAGNENRRQYDFGGVGGGVDEESGLPASTHFDNRPPASSVFGETCRMILLAKIQTFTTFYYIFIFLYGQVLYLNLDNKCAQDAPAMERLVYLYILFQYLTFVIPFFLICFCVVILFVIVRRYGHLLPNSQVPATDTIINNLPSKKYPHELPGDHECRICMCEYENEDEIIQLPCNALHHFHGECIKKWLRVNGVCPICRKKLEEMAPSAPPGN